MTMRIALAAIALAAVGAAAACGGDTEAAAITADGSIAVGPLISEAAEQFRLENDDVRIEVTTSGTGVGFDRFCAGETDIVTSSRAIDEDEAKACADAGIRYVELHVANDGFAVAIHRPLLYDWVTCLTVEQLRRMWEADSQISNWNQVDASFPDVPLRLYGPAQDTGRFNYFTFVINGERGESRTDYAATEDDNNTVQGIADDKGALGYFRYTYYEAHRDRLKALAVDGGQGCVAPSIETIQDGTYKPLSRPLFMYVKRSALTGNPQVRRFTRFLVENEQRIAQNTRLVPLSADQVASQLRKLARAIGSGASQ
jgi:phosphate transport system substrate-binding protein